MNKCLLFFLFFFTSFSHANYVVIGNNESCFKINDGDVIAFNAVKAFYSKTFTCFIADSNLTINLVTIKDPIKGNSSRISKLYLFPERRSVFAKHIVKKKPFKLRSKTFYPGASREIIMNRVGDELYVFNSDTILNKVYSDLLVLNGIPASDWGRYNERSFSKSIIKPIISSGIGATSGNYFGASNNVDAVMVGTTIGVIVSIPITIATSSPTAGEMAGAMVAGAITANIENGDSLIDDMPIPPTEGLPPKKPSTRPNPHNSAENDNCTRCHPKKDEKKGKH